MLAWLLGATAYIFADFSHEVLGHDAVCMLQGGHAVVLSSTFFRCSLHSRIIDAAGPIANILVAIAVWLVLRLAPIRAGTLRLWLMLAFVFNWWWASAQMVYCAILNRDDWAFALSGLLPSWLWRPGLLVLGTLLYIAAARMLLAERPERSLLRTAYISSGTIAIVIAAFFTPDRLGAIREAALETLAVNIGLLLVARRLGSGAIEA